MSKNNSSQYLTAPSHTPYKSPFTLVKLMASVMVAVILGVFFAGSAVSAATVKEAEALDWTQWIMCSVAPDPSKQLYQYSQSSDMQYQLRSKSTMNSGVADVSSGLNWILDLFGPGFEEINESILGYELNSSERAADKENDGAANFNKGTTVSVYDRFGVAGMGFNSYQGEWKYILVDACSDSEPMDPKAGLYYEERLEPRSTWEYISTSSDPRTVQFDRGILIHFWTSIVNVVANAIFWLTKTMVVITIALISFSLSDIVSVLGVSDLLGGKDGIFTTLFDGIFLPLVFLAFLITAFKIFWDGIVKKQYRSSIITLLRSLAMFVLAFIIAANPSFWMALPNNFAVFGQSILLTSLSGNLPNSGGLCDTDVGNFKVNLKSKDVTNTKSNMNLLAVAAEDMRSAVSCQFWQAFLFRPWVQGQFGADWKLLWANDKTPKWADKSASAELNNLNSETVGDAGVPIGNGKFINNWAIYQLSAQTNVHAASGEGNQGEPSKVTSGVANDWWRIVDALSNYDEEKKEVELIVGSGISGGSTTVSGDGSYAFPIANPSKSSDFGMRTHPVTGSRTLHAGIDYSAPTGTPLFAVADGTIVTKRSSTGGNIIELQAVDGWTYRYLHLSAYVAQNGQQVAAGQEIGKVGSTGRVTGAHLHFETRSPTNEKIDPNSRLTAMGFNPSTGAGAGADQTLSPGAGTGTTVRQPYEYGVPKNNPVTSYWDTWVGNNSFGRIFASLSSVVIAGVGLLAPLVLSAMSAIYALGTAVLMAFAPIFLLLGCWGGRGWDLFKGWGELVVNTTLKRIIVGLLLALTISFTTTALQMMEEVGWFQGMIILILLSLLILNSREKMVNTLASVRFAGADLSGTANRIGGIARQQTIGRAQTAVKDTAKVSASVTAGAIGARAAGGTLRQGAKAGLKEEIRNFTYRKPSLNHARVSYENFKQHGKEFSNGGDHTEEERIFNGQEQCNSCGKVLDFESEQNGTHLFYGGRTIEGNLLCFECFHLEGDIQNAVSVQHRYNPVLAKKEKEEALKINAERNKEAQNLYRRQMTGSTKFSSVKNTGESLSLQNDLITDTNSLKKNKDGVAPKNRVMERQRKLINFAKISKLDIDAYRDSIRNGEDVEMPPIPDVIKPYITEGMMKTAWSSAGKNDNYDGVLAIYVAGILSWFNDEIRLMDGEDNPRHIGLGKPQEEFDNLLEAVRTDKRTQEKGNL